VLQLGVSLPQTDIGGDPLVVKEFATTAEALGFSHLATYDHVVGINPQSRPEWRGPYTSGDCFHDTFALFGFLAACTQSIELSTHVLILSQRQTVLVARQAASVDVLSGGRLRLGIGVGWNPVEYVALNETFNNRGKRSEEQAAVLRALWTDQHVNFKGKWHDIPDVGLNPMPIQRPIPLWFGGNIEYVASRIAQHGDGWITLYQLPGDDAKSARDTMLEAAQKAGRNPDDIGLDAWVSMGSGTPDDWRAEFAAWKELGASHITLNTAFKARHHRRITGTNLAEHLTAIEFYRDAVQDLL
jgi:probable F420-dependent oxidoreductase